MLPFCLKTNQFIGQKKVDFYFKLSTLLVMKRRYYKYPKWAVVLCKISAVCFTSLIFWLGVYVCYNLEQIKRNIKTIFQQETKVAEAFSRGPYSDALCSNFKTTKINVACPSKKN